MTVLFNPRFGSGLNIASGNEVSVDTKGATAVLVTTEGGTGVDSYIKFGGTGSADATDILMLGRTQAYFKINPSLTRIRVDSSGSSNCHFIFGDFV